jgi:hypothetical protein
LLGWVVIVGWAWAAVEKRAMQMATGQTSPDNDAVKAE